MLEALWSVEFQSSFGLQGNGVVVFETGRVFGGDSTMIYVGNFVLSMAQSTPTSMSISTLILQVWRPWLD